MTCLNCVAFGASARVFVGRTLKRVLSRCFLVCREIARVALGVTGFGAPTSRRGESEIHCKALHDDSFPSGGLESLTPSPSAVSLSESSLLGLTCARSRTNAANAAA